MEKMQSFQELSLPEPMQRALESMNYSTPTPIQQQAIPAALGNRDIIGCAQTGTGKTAAFSIPLIANLIKNTQKNGLILVPTRELAEQVGSVVLKLLKNYPQIKVAILIGGKPMRPQIQRLSQKPRIIIATPGRLNDHLRQGNLSLSKSEIVILDEADRMLDMGFEPQIREIMRFLPKCRQTMLFSATLPPSIEKMVGRYLKDPVKIMVGAPSRPAAKIVQSMVSTTQNGKNEALLDQLNDKKESAVIIFARTKRRTDRLAQYLSEWGFKVGRIHGDRTQKQRNDAIDGFRRGRFKILVATDIAARGIDIPHIGHVINYDLPMVPEDYIHRIGRTGRAGAEGSAISLVTPEEKGQWRSISKFIEKTARH